MPSSHELHRDHGESLITQELACGRGRNSRIAKRSNEDSPVGMQSCRIARRASDHPVRRGHAAGERTYEFSTSRNSSLSPSCLAPIRSSSGCGLSCVTAKDSRTSTPHNSSKELCAQFPDRFTPRQYRTLARRVNSGAAMPVPVV
jgi:hypothetical protein